MRPLIAWVKAGADPDKAPKYGDQEWILLVIDGDGPRQYHHKLLYPEAQSYPVTLGSGRDIALGALRAKKSPREAVAIACDEDVWSGGEIQVVDLREALGLVAAPRRTVMRGVNPKTGKNIIGLEKLEAAE